MKKIITIIFAIFLFVICFAQENLESAIRDTLQEQEVVLEKPTNLEITALNDRYLSLKWQDNCAIETGYKIERKENHKDFSTIADLNENTTTFMDENVKFGIKYTYRILCYNSELTSEYSRETVANTIFPNPSNLSKKQLNDTSAIINWKDYCDFEKGFIIERKDSSGNFIELGRLEENKKYYIDRNLKTGIDYVYRVKAFNDHNESEYSEEIKIKLVFAVPSHFSAEPLNDSAVRLTWRDKTDYETGFILERKTQNSGYETIARLGANATFYNDESLTSGIEYFYKVKAISELNESEFTNDISTQTSFPGPTNLEVDVINDNSVKLYWVNRNRTIDGFIIEKKAEADTFAVVEKISDEKRTFICDGLELEVKYTFRIKAYTAFNESGYSNEVTAITNFSPPENLYAEEIDDRSLMLYWEDGCNFEEKFVIERQSGNEGFTQIAELPRNSTSYKDDGLTYGVSYNYRILAITEFSQSCFSNVITAQTYFPKPSYLSAIVVDDQAIKLNWRDNCDFDDGFILQRKDGEADFVDIGVFPTEINDFMDINLSFGTDYSYRIQTITKTNKSDFSEIITTKTIFPTPSGFSVTVIDDQSVQLYWLDNCKFEEGYILEKKQGNGEFTEIKTLPQNSTNYIDSGLKYKEEYSYRVKAFTNKNKSQTSKIITISTAFPLPLNLNVQIIGDAIMGLSWNDNCDFERGYHIERSTDGVNFQQINRTAENVIDYTDDQLSYGVNYTYRVCAFSNINKSDFTNEITKLMIVDIPENIQTSVINDKKIRISWDDKTNIENGFIIQRKHGDQEFSELTKLNANISSYVDSNTEEHVTYSYRVKAFTTKSESEFSEIVSDVCHYGKLRIPEEYSTIQSAIDSAINGNIVLVRSGTYKENLNYKGKQISISSYYKIDENDALIDQTILDGNDNGTVVRIENCGDNNGIYGFTIQNGKGSDNRGGGIFIYNSKPELFDLKIKNNSALDFGGGISMVDSDPKITNVLITKNTSIGEKNGYGGGLYASNSLPELLHVIISENTARKFGGGLYIYRSNVEIKNCIVSQNTCISEESSSGGGLYIQYSEPIFENVTIFGNSAKTGGAIFCNIETDLKIINSILWNNLPQEISFHNFGNIKTTISYSVLHKLEDGILTNNNGTVFLRAGLIQDDPKFIDANAANFKLQQDSPCIDAGATDEKYLDADGSANDIGAYGGENGNW